MELLGPDIQILLLLAFLLIFFVPCIFFLITLQNTMKAIEPENRRMKPSHVWLILIPLVGFVYVFLVVIAIANSCKLQLEKYGIFSEQKPTFAIGLAWAICLVISFFVKLLFVPSMILMIIYWVKVADTKKQILQMKEVFANKEISSIF